MLGKADATPMIAVTDLDRAKSFYEDKLGLEVEDEWGGEGATLKSGDTLVNVYRSEFAGHQQGDRAQLRRRGHRDRGQRAQSQGHHVRTLRPARP